MAAVKKRPARLVFVLGGASSGKSDVALDLAVQSIDRRAARAFVATGEGLDDEMTAKIARHRLSRHPAWTTAEVPLELTAWMEQNGSRYRVVVVDCLTMWLSNHYGQGRRDQEVLQDLRGFLQAVRRSSARVVAVANELGMGIVPVDAASRRFRELAGTVNRLVAQDADETFFVVGGLPMRLK